MLGKVKGYSRQTQSTVDRVISMIGSVLRIRKPIYKISSMPWVVFFRFVTLLKPLQSNGLLDLYTWDEVRHLLHAESRTTTQGTPPTPPSLTLLDSASLYLMVAIGAQCYGPTKEAVVWAAGLFSYARKLAFAQMLENPSLDLVRVFLLMAFYMFGACRRNSAFMYLGCASRAADILGLHESTQHKHTNPSTRNSR
jgi:hypothetical protein